MAGVGKQRAELVLITDALAFIESQTGFAFERRQFLRYIEAAALKINGEMIELHTLQVGERWYLLRRPIESIIKAFAQC